MKINVNESGLDKSFQTIKTEVMNIQQDLEVLTPAPERRTISLSGSEAVLKSFLAEGVDTIFGYPG